MFSAWSIPKPGLMTNLTKLIQCLKRCSASVNFTVGDALLAVAPEAKSTSALHGCFSSTSDIIQSILPSVKDSL